MDAYSSNKEFFKKKCGLKPNGEELLCSPFSSCCGDMCCPEKLTFIYVWFGIGIVMCVALVIIFLCQKKKQTAYKRMKEPRHHTQKTQGVFKVVIENEWKCKKLAPHRCLTADSLLYPLNGPHNGVDKKIIANSEPHVNAKFLIDELCGPDKEDGKVCVANV